MDPRKARDIQLEIAQPQAGSLDPSSKQEPAQAHQSGAVPTALDTTTPFDLAVNEQDCNA
jgi:hypothetical protein